MVADVDVAVVDVAEAVDADVVDADVVDADVVDAAVATMVQPAVGCPNQSIAKRENQQDVRHNKPSSVKKLIARMEITYVLCSKIVRQQHATMVILCRSSSPLRKQIFLRDRELQVLILISTTILKWRDLVRMQRTFQH